MTDQQQVNDRMSWWRRHRAWVILTALTPVSYFLLGAGGGWLVDLGDRTDSLGWSLLALLVLLAAVAAPIVFGVIALRKGYLAYRRWRRAHGHLTKKEQTLQQHQDAYAQGWQHAIALRTALLRDQLPPYITVWGVVPRPGERFFLTGQLGYARYYGTDVTYGRSSVVAFGRPSWVAGALIGNAIGNSISRSRANAMAATQWREQQNVEVLVSNERVLCNVAGRGWLGFDLITATAIYPDPEHFNVVFEFGGQTSPLSLTGPMAPALATLAVRFTQGPVALENHPALRPLADR